MTHAFPTRSASDLSDIRAQEEITPAICCHIGYHQKGDRGYPRTDDIIGSENVEACGEPKINGCERQPRPRRCGYARHKAGGLMWLIICINIGIEARKAESAAHSVRQGNDPSELGHGDRKSTRLNSSH